MLDNLNKIIKGLNLEKKHNFYENNSIICHIGSIPVFKDPKSKVVFHGGGSIRKMTIPRGSFIIDVGCGMLQEENFNTVISKNLSKVFMKEMNNIQDLDLKGVLIHWRDGDVIELKKNFWELLIEEIRLQKRDVYVGCVGGHGRTGTVLSILAGLLGVSKDPVKFIRKNYCEKAVETVVQLEYIKEITGLTSSEKTREESLTAYFEHKYE